MIKNLKNLHEVIYQDLKKNEDQLANRSITYSKKYRGDLLNDVSVIILENDKDVMVRIFLKNKSGYVNHTMSLNNKKLTTVELIEKEYEKRTDEEE